ADIFVDLQIGLDRTLAPADQISLVRLEAVQRQLVLFGITGNGPQTELIGRTEHPDGDLAAIGDKDFADRHLVNPGRRNWPVPGRGGVGPAVANSRRGVPQGARYRTRHWRRMR